MYGVNLDFVRNVGHCEVIMSVDRGWFQLYGHHDVSLNPNYGSLWLVGY